MPRGARNDVAVTALLFKNGLLLDKRSFVSLDANEPHLFLKGKDMSAQRMRVIARDKATCRNCGQSFMRTYGDTDSAEIHHVIPRGKGGSDDLGNLELRCGRFISECHTKEHIRPHFGQSRAQAVTDFNKLYPPEEK